MLFSLLKHLGENALSVKTTIVAMYVEGESVLVLP